MKIKELKLKGVAELNIEKKMIEAGLLSFIKELFQLIKNILQINSSYSNKKYD